MQAWNTREIRLTHPGAESITPESFELISRDLPPLEADELLVKTSFASLDPSQRIRMKYASAGFVPPAGVVGTVVASTSPRFIVGDVVSGDGTWATHGVLSAAAAVPFTAPLGVALHHAVGLLGLTGLTAYFGVTRVARPRPGDKLVVSGAFGGVGQVAAQLAAAAGADVLGLVGGPDKVAALQELGIRGLDHRSTGWLAELEAWAPDGVDVLFDNVWGEPAARVVEHLKPLGRVALCGQMSGLNAPVVPPLPLDNWFRLVTGSLTIQGFRAVDYTSDFPQARSELGRMLREGQVGQEVQIVDGWEVVGPAFCDMLAGRTIGKLVVKVES